jgi:hypothetical protein
LFINYESPEKITSTFSKKELLHPTGTVNEYSKIRNLVFRIDSFSSKCHHCGKNKDIKLCTHCRVVHYCNPKCQLEEWNFHELLVKKQTNK